MKQLFFLAIAVAIALNACKSGDSKTSQTISKNTTNKNLDSVFAKYYEDRLRLFPLEATGNGDSRYNDLLPIDFTDSYRATLNDFFSSNFNAVTKIEREGLSDQQKTYYDIFKREMEMSIEGLGNRDNLIPFQQFRGLTLTMGQLGSGEGNQPFKTAKDYDDWLKRITAFGNWADSAIVYFNKGMASGYVLPKTLVTKIIPQMDAMVTTDATKSIL